MNHIRLRMTYDGFGQLWQFIKDDWAFALQLGFTASYSMTPDQFININHIELVDEEN